MNQSLSFIKVLDVSVTSSPLSQIIEYITTRLEKPSEKVAIFTPNPEIIVRATKDKEYRDILNSAQVALPDGIGVLLGARILSAQTREGSLSLHERITGADFVEILCEKLSKRIETVGFLGGRGGVAKKTAECLQRRYPGLKVAFALEEWPEQQEDRGLKIENPKLKSKADTYYKYSPAMMKDFPKCDVLFVAYGAPKQEYWIYENLPHIKATVAMGVGGSFDYISGYVTRAPFLVRLFGFEWLYRLVKEPWRWKRQLALIEYVRLILSERMRRKNKD